MIRQHRHQLTTVQIPNTNAGILTAPGNELPIGTKGDRLDWPLQAQELPLEAAIPERPEVNSAITATRR